jgi:uncharacterized protein YkwD
MRRIPSSIVAATAAGVALAPPVHAAPSFDEAVLMRLNETRRAYGLRPVRQTLRLRWVARHHSTFLARARRLQHDSADGSSFARRIRRVARYRRAGETVAFGRTPRWIVRAWLESPAHRAIILDGRYRFVGIGAARGPAGRMMYVTADFTA